MARAAAFVFSFVLLLLGAARAEMPRIVACGARSQLLAAGPCDAPRTWSRAPSSRYALAPNAAPVPGSPEGAFVVSTSSAPVALYSWIPGEALPSLVSPSPLPAVPDSILVLPERDAVLVAYASASRVDAYALSTLDYAGVWTDSLRAPGFSGPASLARSPWGTVAVALAGRGAVWEMSADGSTRLSVVCSLPSPSLLAWSEDDDGETLHVVADEAQTVARFRRAFFSDLPAADRPAGVPLSSHLWVSLGAVELRESLGNLSSLVVTTAGSSALATSREDAALAGVAGAPASVSLLTGESQDALDVRPVPFSAAALSVTPLAVLHHGAPYAPLLLDSFSVSVLDFLDNDTAAADPPRAELATRALLAPCEPGAPFPSDPRAVLGAHACGASTVLVVDDRSAYLLDVSSSAAPCFAGYLYFAADPAVDGALVASAWDARAAALYLVQRAGPDELRALAVSFPGRSCLADNATLRADEARVEQLPAPVPSSASWFFVAPSLAGSNASLCYLQPSPLGQGRARVACPGSPSRSHDLRAPGVSLADAWAFWSERNATLLLLDHVGVTRAFPLRNGTLPATSNVTWAAPSFFHTCRLRGAYEPYSDVGLVQWCDEPDALYWFAPGAPSLDLRPDNASGASNGSVHAARSLAAAASDWVRVAKGDWVANATSAALSVAPYAPSLAWVERAPPRRESGTCMAGSGFVCSPGGSVLVAVGSLFAVTLCFVGACLLAGVVRRRRRAAAAAVLPGHGEEEDARGLVGVGHDESAQPWPSLHLGARASAALGQARRLWNRASACGRSARSGRGSHRDYRRDVDLGSEMVDYGPMVESDLIVQRDEEVDHTLASRLAAGRATASPSSSSALEERETVLRVKGVSPAPVSVVAASGDGFLGVPMDAVSLQTPRTSHRETR